MALSDLRREMVLAAMTEYDTLGRDVFLETHGYGPARGYFVRYDGRRYDSKAIAGVAHRGVDGHPLRAGDFSGGNATVARVLENLGFEVTRPDKFDDGQYVDDLIHQVRTLKTAASATPGERKRHQPLTLLWALGRVSRGEERLAPWSETSFALSALLRRFGHPGDGAHAEFPVLHLHHQGLWDFPGHEDVPRASGSAAQRWMRELQPISGLRSWVHEIVTEQPAVHARIVLCLLEEYFRDVDRDALLAATSLAPEPDVDSPLQEDASPLPKGTSVPGRRSGSTSRVIRDTALAEQVKLAHDHQCQICGTRLVTRRGGYAEGAHIRPLGSPHDGPDEPGNLLCLCPNHHVLLDGGAIKITDDLAVVHVSTGRPIGPLRLVEGHRPEIRHLAYHRHLCEEPPPLGR
ncbi:HNH endonuclease [Sphaerisporangium dianthi]|uniref:HNH endonuclease n=1 Tax=Sphaerisporangium dianthi TaxID=1436120 RepID=A0ABV9CQ69_9ACTN